MPRPPLDADNSWFKQLFELSPDPTWIIENNHFVECNDAAVRTLGYADREALMNVHPSRLSPARQPDGQTSFAKAERMMKVAKAKGLHRFEWTHTKANGSEFVAEVTLSSIELNGRQVIYCVWRDITERKLMEEQIRVLAFHDQLTGLPNRRLLNDRLGQALAAGKRSGYFGALMLLDLDNFKPLNDAHGHAAGDMLLVEVAHRLKACVRDLDTVARFGGDEFVIMLAELSTDRDESASQSENIAEKIRASLSAPYRLTIKRRGKPSADIEHRCTASIGVTLFRDHTVHQEDVIKRADTAMYDAKESGRNAIRFAPSQPEWGEEREKSPSMFLHLTWRPAYRCGNPLIDEQHRALFATANALLGSILAGTPAEQLGNLIDTVMRDIVQHFNDEETILNATGFPDAAEHAAIHRRLIADATSLAEHFHSGRLTSGELFQFMAHELIARHLLGADRDFFPYLEKSK
ncbi:MAG: diguanylate cyclase [Propionivibrio sp.]